MNNLLSLSYWFEAYAEPLGGVWLRVLSGFILGLWCLAFIFGLFGRKLSQDPSTRRIIKKLSSLFGTLGVLLAVTLFFTQTQTPYLGSRWWWLLWLLLFVFWLWFILSYALRVAPKERSQRQEHEQRLKYLS